MSRVGRQPIAIPEKVTVRIEGQTVTVEGPKGALAQVLPAGVRAQVKDRMVTVERLEERQAVRALHGLSRTLVANMVQGVTAGFSKELEIQGVGFKAQVAPSSASPPKAASAGRPGGPKAGDEVDQQTLTLTLGFSHPVTYPLPAGVTVETPRPTQVIVKGMDKALVGQVAATIRAFFEAEPYKGTGIRYVGEVVRRKAGKAVATTKTA